MIMSKYLIFKSKTSVFVVDTENNFQWNSSSIISTKFLSHLTTNESVGDEREHLFRAFECRQQTATGLPPPQVCQLEMCASMCHLHWSQGLFRSTEVSRDFDRLTFEVRLHVGLPSVDVIRRCWIVHHPKVTNVGNEREHSFEAFECR